MSGLKGARFPAFCRRVGLTLFVALLAACGALPPSPNAPDVSRDSLAAFSLTGRFSLRQGGQSYSGRFSLRHVGPDNELLLASPFGQGLAEITTGVSGAKLTTSDGETHLAPDAESLTRRLLGYPLPLERLVDWLRARPGPDDAVTPDRFGRPSHLRQFPWQIEYGYDNDDPGALPVRVFAERLDGDTAVDLRLRIDEWNRLPAPTPERRTP